MGWTIITGANRGIGLELTRQLLEQGHQILAVCRTASADLKALDVRIIGNVDVTHDDLSAVHEVVQTDAVDLLINNAGLLRRTSLHNLNLDDVRRQFEVNTLGPIKLTHILLNNLQRGSKVVLASRRPLTRQH